MRCSNHLMERLDFHGNIDEYVVSRLFLSGDTQVQVQLRVGRERQGFPESGGHQVRLGMGMYRCQLGRMTTFYSICHCRDKYDHGYTLFVQSTVGSGKSHTHSSRCKFQLSGIQLEFDIWGRGLRQDNISVRRDSFHRDNRMVPIEVCQNWSSMDKFRIWGSLKKK